MRRFRVVGAVVIATAALGAAIAGFASAAGDDGRSSDGAIAFAPGIDYGEALVRLHITQTSGTADPAMTEVAALPDGVTAVIPDDPGASVIIDPAAPFGWDTQLGIPVSATYMLDDARADLARSSRGPWPEGARLVVPDLPACMVRTARAAAGAECGADDVVTVARTIALP